MMQVILIGLGMVADTHLAAIKEANEIALVGVVGRNQAKAVQFAQRAAAILGYKVQAFISLEEALASQRVDFAILVTPPNARLDLVRGLTQRKIPVLMEKPIERNFEAAKHIVETCEVAEVPTGIFFQNRTRTASRALFQAAVEGELGDILMADIRVPWWREQSYYDEPGRGTYERDGGGVLINQAIHTLDLALWMLGPLKELQAKLHLTKLHRMESEDWAAAVFETVNGTVGTLCATTAAFPGAPESIILQGTKAFARLEAGVLTITERDGRIRTIGSEAKSGDGADPMAFSHVWHQRILEDFSDCLRNGQSPLISARDGLKSHAVIDAMERSHKSGQRVSVEQV